MLIVSLDTYNLRLTQPLVDCNLWERGSSFAEEGPARHKKHIYKPETGLNDISVLLKSCYGRNLDLEKAFTLLTARAMWD